MNANVEYFFSSCRNPINVSNLITALASGNQIKADRVPVEVLPHVVLLTTIGLRSFQQQIVDDYALLLQRTLEADRDADVTGTTSTGERMALPVRGGFLVWDIAIQGPRGEYTLDELPDAGYMFDVYEELINADAEGLFAWLGKAGSSTGQASPTPQAQHNSKTKGSDVKRSAKRKGAKP